MARRFQGADSTELLTQANILNEDAIQTRHSIGTTNDSDKGTPFSIFQSGPIATCESLGTDSVKVATISNYQDFTLLNGREVTVYFANGNDAESPFLNVNSTGSIALALENQSEDVVIDSGSWLDGVYLHLKYVEVTVDNVEVKKWVIIGHNIASQTSNYTIYADGRQVYNATDEIATNSEKVLKAGAMAYISASSKTITGRTIAAGSVLRIMFTAAITGTDTTTGLAITYNGTSYPVKVASQGALSDVVAYEVSSSYVYIQANTSIDFSFDGTYFVIEGNPLVYKDSDLLRYADGSIVRFPISSVTNSPAPITSSAVQSAINGLPLVAAVASSTTVTGPDLSTNFAVKVMFTSTITGTDTTTALSLVYNGSTIPVMVNKHGTLTGLYAHEVETSTYKYIQAYTTLEMVYDGTQFIVVGNPVVLSSDNYTIYADGWIKQWGRITLNIIYFIISFSDTNYNVNAIKINSADTIGIYNKTTTSAGLPRGATYDWIAEGY